MQPEPIVDSNLWQSGETKVSPAAAFWRFSPANNPQLRVGVLLDGLQIPRFFCKVLEDIRASNFVHLEMLIFQVPPTPPKREGSNRIARRARRLADKKLRRRLLYDAYTRLDERTKHSDDPLNLIDCSELLAGVDSIEVRPLGENFIHRFPDDVIEKIRAKNLDVLLRFGFNILRGDILKTARYGVWSYHHGDNDYYRGGPAHFWEIYERSPLSGVILQVLTEELDAGLVLCKSLFATEPTLYVSRNRYPAYSGSADFVIRKLNELHQFGWTYLQEKAVVPQPYRGKRRIYRTPTNWEMVRWLGPALIKKIIRYPLRREIVQHWRIGLRTTRQNPLWKTGNLEGFRWLSSARGHFWADPFLLVHGGRRWMFFENYSYAQRRAVISCAEISEAGTVNPPTNCLSAEGHHFSYPYVFQSGSDLYMVPESADSKSVDLYRCEDFPNKWVFVRSLLKGRFVDSTVWQSKGLWWLMTTSAELGARAGSLLLFFAQSLTGVWSLHRSSPISNDIRSNRGAGRVFLAEDDRLIRPSQSCSPIYGYSFSLNEITELCPERYSERVFRTVTPEFWKDLCGVHTYNIAGDVEVIDGATMTPRSQV